MRVAQSALVHFILIGCCSASWLLVPVAVADTKRDSASTAKKSEPAKLDAKAVEPDLNELSMDVAALQTLVQLKATPEQLTLLRKLASRTAETGHERKDAKASAAVRGTLESLRTALIEGDDERSGELGDKLTDQLDAEKEKTEFDDGVEVTDAARKDSPAFCRQLSVRQVAAMIATYDPVPEPLEKLLNALDKARSATGDEWKAVRDELPEEIGRLVAGFTKDEASKVSDRVFDLLQQARDLSEDDYKKQRPELEKTVRELVNGVGPTDVLRHLVEYTVAELLSNQRLPSVLDARAAQMKKKE